MRDRLIELCENLILSCKSSLCEDCEHKNIDYPNCMSVHFADYLLETGVIVPPVKVGDKLYKPWKAGGRNVVAEFVVIAIISAIKDEYFIKYKKIGGTICYQVNIAEVGKTVFLTKEEAEKALKGGAKE